MDNIKAGDIVRYERKDGTFGFLIVTWTGSGKIKGISPLTDGDYSDEITVSAKKALKCESVIVSQEQMRRFVRYEISIGELAPQIYPYELIRCPETYIITPEDMETALINCRKHDLKQTDSEWYTPFLSLYTFGAIAVQADTSDSDDEKVPCLTDVLPTDAGMVSDTVCDLSEMLFYTDTDMINEYISMLRTHCENRKKPMAQRDYPDVYKYQYMRRFSENAHNYNSATDEEIALLVRLTDELCNTGSAEAMDFKAYCLYGGNRAYACDYVQAAELIHKLYDETGLPQYANTLGYIYYYGRTGEVDYKKAFEYFSAGAAAGMHESRYKLADMYTKGLYVKQNKGLAYSILSLLYDNVIEEFICGDYECKLADVALRMADAIADATGHATHNAVRMILMSKLAIEMRKPYNYIGDDTVAARIDETLERMTGDIKPKRSAVFYPSYLHVILSENLTGNNRMEAHIKKSADGKHYSISFKLVKRAYERKNPCLVIVDAGSLYAGLMHTFTVKIDADDYIAVNGKRFRGDDTVVTFDEVDFNEFRLYGKKVMQIGPLVEYRTKFPPSII